MESWRNPYATSPAAPPPLLTGRDEWLARFEDYLRAGEEGYPVEYLMLHGYRGMGKTVLLNSFRDLARKRGWVAQRVEASPTQPLLPALAEDLSALLPANAKTVRARVRRAVEELTLGVSLIGVTAQVRVTAAPASIDRSFTRVVLEVAAAARKDHAGVALLLDELQIGEPWAIQAIGRALQAATGDRLPVVMAAGGLPTMPDHVRAALTYGERYRFVELGALSDPAARAALVIPAQDQGVAYAPAAVHLLVREARGYPFLIQLHGRYAWEAATGASSITLAHARTAVTAARHHLVESVFRGRWSRLTPAERGYVSAMAALGDGPVRTADVARAMGTTTSGLSMHRRALLDKGVILAPERGLVDFTMPGLARFVREEDDDERQVPAPVRRPGTRPLRRAQPPSPGPSL